VIFFLWDCGLNLGLQACKAGAQPPEPHLQPIFAMVILEMGSWQLFALALNCDPLDLSLQSSRDYRDELLCLGSDFF
jgi:hypothetical protein